ncbi:hypothetical protein [Calothrix sp. UHCC 0171]|uniref:hypothetical protein n=1 Tax=Calothrix sp. UHCC 0171 TaxID=3110245 RepID=UPI002B20DC00|nr:hypothetical protein [Calothrix sp. UHCC 0171]MEA5572565.1 hypothetical protein [Calothrix sp. UHCC 0171]
MFNFKFNLKSTGKITGKTDTNKIQTAFNSQIKSSQIKILTLTFLVTAFSSISNQSWAKSTITLNYKSQDYKSQNILIAQQFTGWVSKLFGKRPTKTNSARSLICPVSPGLVDNLIIWHDKPLFLWHGQLEPEKLPEAKLIVREFETQKVVWETDINITQQKILYKGTKQLQPGKLYQWLITQELITQELSTQKAEEIIKPTLFRIMSAAERDKINLDLQEMEVKLKANKASSEEIALRKAEYFLNYEVPNQNTNKSTHLWSDAILLFYSVENPSPLLQQEREKLLKDICEPSVSTNRPISL